MLLDGQDQMGLIFLIMLLIVLAILIRWHLEGQKKKMKEDIERRHQREGCVVAVLLALGLVIRLKCKGQKKNTVNPSNEPRLDRMSKTVIICGSLTVLSCILIGFFWIYGFSNRKRKISKKEVYHMLNPEQHVFNISSLVESRNQRLNSPSAFVTIEQINTNNRINKPPEFDDPPCYEEAIKMQAVSNSKPSQAIS